MVHKPISQPSDLQLLRQKLHGQSPAGLSACPPRTPNRQALFGCLPVNIPQGSLVEVLSQGDGTGASVVAFRMSCLFQQEGYPVVVIDPQHEFCPPGADKLGLSLLEMTVVRPSKHDDVLWVLEQSLRSQARSTVVCGVDQIAPTAYRRLKLAAERGQSRGLLLRPAKYRSASSWADVRVLVEPRPLPRSTLPIQSRRLGIEVLHLKGRGFEKQTMVVDISDETGVVSVASELAGSTTVAESA